MKKLILFLALASIGVAHAAYKDGTYDGVGKGNESKIHVQVVVKAGKITQIDVKKHGETDMIIAGPIEYMIPEMIEKQSTQVDAIGGATNSSLGIKKAVEDALKKAQ